MPKALRGLIPYSRVGLTAGAWLLLDAAAAVGFAAGLALAVWGLAGKPSWFAAGVALILACVSLRALANAMAIDTGASSALKVKTAVRRNVADAVLHTQPGAAAPQGERLAAIVEDVEALDGWFARYLPAQNAARFAPVLVLVAVAAVSLPSALILAVAFIPFILLMALAGMTTASAARRQLDALARLSGLFIDRVRALPLVLAYGAGEQQTAKIAEASGEVRDRT
ncbi:MAG: ABC transporter transmembrane domain-containing protein, partial [Pseudomonadota bacterium]